ncbi:TetR/AcrR family transcriptional regulator [Alcaligenes sp. NLF5-7]|uniref:TetR/AcrR family transcriptional regulator n=1 Tax=Alcaligenes sp. NLF5-7 TaxID=2918755 RepID=UPI0020C45BF6|nr:TetR/AcrR family transcriptional regulator [Alcaligenes sp. NLF5-7]UTM01627.1 TetR/AcrR family transcriptional regulator [Alcaligenes sp. NLF5-7]
MAYRQTPAVEARLQDNRGRILEAARVLVSEGGWQEAQVASVAAAAGIATGTVYRYFPSKAELFAEVLSLVSQREVDVLTDIAQADGASMLRLHAAVSTFVKRAMRNPRLAYALIAEPCDKEIDAARLVYRAAISQVIHSIVSMGQDAQEMRQDVQPDIAATVIVGGFMEGLIGPLSPLSRQQHDGTDSYQRQVAALADQIALMACASVAALSATP